MRTTRYKDEWYKLLVILSDEKRSETRGAREKKWDSLLMLKAEYFGQFFIFFTVIFCCCKEMIKLLLIKIVPCIWCVHFDVRCVCMVTPAANVRTLFCVQDLSM